MYQIINDVAYPDKFHSHTTTSTRNQSYVSQICQRAREMRDTVSARRKREILLSVGWSEFQEHGFVGYSNPDVKNNEAFFLDSAWNAQLLRELGQRYWGSDVS